MKVYKILTRTGDKWRPFRTLTAGLMLLLVMMGCASEEVEKEPENLEPEIVFPVTLEEESFTIGTPEGWEMITVQGIDTRVGKITNGEIEIWYDRGDLAFRGIEFIEETENTIYLEHLKVDGVPAIIRKEKLSDGISLSLYVDNGPGYRNWLYVRDPDATTEELVKNIFKSHKFTAEEF